MAPKSQKRTEREISAYNYFKDAGFNVRFSDLNQSVKPFELSPEAKKYTDPIVKKIMSVDELDEYSLDLLTEQFKTEKQIDEILDLIKKDQERQLGELTDYFLEAGDKKDASERVARKLEEEKKQYENDWEENDKKLTDSSFKHSGWKDDFETIQRNLKSLGFSDQRVFDESIFSGYENEEAFVTNWINQEKDPSKLLQKHTMSSSMIKCASLTGPLIEIYRAGKEFCNYNINSPENFGEPFENANEALTKFSAAVRKFLDAVNSGIKKTDKGESIDPESMTSTIGQISTIYESLGGDLDIEKVKEADSGFLLFDTGKKLEHQQNIKYIEQNRKACRYIRQFLELLPHYVYATTKEGEIIPGTQKESYICDPIAIQDELEKDCSAYLKLNDKCHALRRDLKDKQKELEMWKKQELEPDEENRKKAFDAMNGMYKDMKDFQVNAASFKEKIMKRKAELELARKAKEDEERKKAEEDRKNKELREAKEKEERKRQEEARKKEEENRIQEKAENTVQRVQNADEDTIDANIYRKELLRLTKELTSKTYHIGQRNSRGFINLKNALSRMLNPKENYDKKEIMPKNDFLEQLTVLEDACAEYSQNHENGNLNDNQMTRLKIMSRIKNVINMAKDDVDPMSIEGRRRMLVEKYNNAKFIDTLKNSKATAEEKLAAKNSMLKYDSIGPMAILEVEKNPAMKDLLDKFKVNEMSDAEYVQNAIDHHKDNEIKTIADAMLKELKKPGARFLKEINSPQKNSAKVL